MRLEFLPGGLLLETIGGEFVVTIDNEEILRSKSEKIALRKFQSIRKQMEEEYPAVKLTKEQKQEALKRLIGDQALREVRNSTRKSKFEKGNKQGRFDNR